MKKESQSKFVKNKPFNGKQLAKDIIAKRVKEDLTLSVASKQSRVPATSICQVETKGRCLPDMLAKLCNWLEVPVQTYF